MAEDSAAVRVDAWLWAVRIYKSRSLATTACRARRGGRGAGEAGDAGATGMRVVVRGQPRDRILIVRTPLAKRVSAPLAAEALIDESPPLPPREERPAPVALRLRGAGRPTKRERRDLDRFRGR